MTAFLARNRKTTIVSVALLLGVIAAAGGGYALAASKTKTITVCADKGAGVLHLKNHGKCKRGQTRVTWNQQGPQGVQGPQGPQGAPAASAWGVVLTSGTVFAGQGIAIQHTSPGTYELTITAPACAQRFNAPVITVNDANPPNGLGTGTFPVAWVGAVNGSTQFNVFTGVVSGGSFTATDHDFFVVDECS
jgi:hypothetical protein